MTVYWNRANTGGVAHATEWRNALCGTSMGYGRLTLARESDRKCKRCLTIVANRETEVAPTA